MSEFENEVARREAVINLWAMNQHMARAQSHAVPDTWEEMEADWNRVVDDYHNRVGRAACPACLREAAKKA